MITDTRKITVVENDCNVCGTDRFVVFHPALPELRVTGSSAEQAAQQLVDRLTAALDAVSDPVHRDPVERAIADVRAFLDKGESPQSACDR